MIDTFSATVILTVKREINHSIMDNPADTIYIRHVDDALEFTDLVVAYLERKGDHVSVQTALNGRV